MGTTMIEQRNTVKRQIPEYQTTYTTVMEPTTQMVPEQTFESVTQMVPRMIPQEVVNMVPEQVTEMIATQVPRTQMREIIETVQPIVTQNVQYQTSVQYGGVREAPQTYPAPMTAAPMTSYPAPMT